MTIGRKTGGGSRKGRPNKASADIRALAQRYTAEALATLAQIMRTGQAEQARVAAANILLDRGHGKAPQSIHATVTHTPPSELDDAELLDIAGRGRGRTADAPQGAPEPAQLH